MQGFHSFFKAAQWAREEEKRKEEKEKEKNVWPGTSEPHRGVAIAQWLELRIRDPKISGWSPGKSGGRFFLFSRVNLLRWLLLRYPFHPRVTAVVHQKKWIKNQKNKNNSRSLSGKRAGGWLQLKTHAPYVCDFAWSDVIWCMVVWCTQNAPRWQQFRVAPAM